MCCVLPIVGILIGAQHTAAQDKADLRDVNGGSCSAGKFENQGAVQMFFFCKRANLKPAGHRKVTLDEHLVWMRAQHEAGTIILSGPSPDLKLGMYLIRAGSPEEADRIAASDPY